MAFSCFSFAFPQTTFLYQTPNQSIISYAEIDGANLPCLEYMYINLRN